MIKAAITPGTHPQRNNNNVISTEPHPLSMTARGGNIIASITLSKLIYFGSLPTTIVPIQQLVSPYRQAK